MKLRVSLAAAMLAAVLIVLCIIAAAVKADTLPAKDDKPAPHFARIGVYEFGNETNIKDAGKSFAKILCERFANKYKDTQFVLITPEDSGYPEGPVLLRHAQRLGEKYGVDAIIDGTFLTYQITGGSWPSRATPAPEVLLQAGIRIVETKDGTIFRNYSFMPTKPHIYPSRIRTQSELWAAAVRYVIDETGSVMYKDGIFFEKEKGE